MKIFSMIRHLKTYTVSLLSQNNKKSNENLIINQCKLKIFRKITDNYLTWIIPFSIIIY